MVFGTASGFGTVDGNGRAVIDLANAGSSFTATQGFVIQGDAAGDSAGRSVSSAGDVNGDGFADLIIGAPYGDAGRRRLAGQAYVIFGTAAGFGTVDLAGRAVISLSNLDRRPGLHHPGRRRRRPCRMERHRRPATSTATASTT